MELNRTGILERLKGGTTTIDNFNYDRLMAPPLSMLLSQYDIDRLYNIATSARYSGNARKKYKAIDEILTKRDFTKLSAGTNRLCYKFLHDDSFVVKVAYDSVAIQDSPAEFANQFILKPFCSKVFEVDPCGVVGSFERVDPITSREEFASVAEDAFELIDGWLLSRGHIMADIGTRYFMNYGLRRGFGLVVIDFPYLYELDGTKIFCISPDSNSETGVCGGQIDYDPGFNELYCQKCGTMYRVKQLAKDVEDKKVIIKGGNKKMKVKISVGGRDLTQTDNRIDGFKPTATKIPSPKVQTVSASTVKVSNGGSNRGSTVTPRNIPKVSIGTRPARGSNSQQNDGYVKPKGDNTTGKVKVQSGSNEQQEPTRRPLPQRGEQNDYRGSTSAATKVTDSVVAQGYVTPAEAHYVMNDQSITGGAATEEIVTEAPNEINAEYEKYKEMAEDLNRELEQCKADLEKSEEERLKVTKNNELLEMQYKSLFETNKTNEETIASYRTSIEELNSCITEQNNRAVAQDSTIAGLQKECDNLRMAAERLKEELNNKPEAEEIDMSLYVTASDHEAAINELNLKNDEMSNIIRLQNDDLYGFCDFAMKVDDLLLNPYMETPEGFTPENIAGTSNLNAVICTLSSLVRLDEGQDDRYVFAFMCSDGSYLCSTEGQYVIASTIGGIDLNDLVIDNFGVAMASDLYARYFSEDEESNDEPDVDEVVEGEVVEDDAETADSGEN